LQDEYQCTGNRNLQLNHILKAQECDARGDAMKNLCPAHKILIHLSVLSTFG